MFLAAVASGVLLHAGPPAPATAPQGAVVVPAATSAAGVDHVAALEERLASLRLAASRSRARVEQRVWPSDGLHTGWWGEWRGGRAHTGIDIDGTTGDPVVAAARGHVVHAGPAPQGYGGYGLMVVIDHGEFSTLYAHLSEIAVVAGQSVEPETRIGAIGTTGSVTGSHLHFETRVGDVPVDPARFMPAR